VRAGRPEDDVIVILVLKSEARVILSRDVALLRRRVLLPVPIVVGAVRIGMLRTLKISHECVVRVDVTIHSVDKGGRMRSYVCSASPWIWNVEPLVCLCKER
jgi:hypothetical protein